MLELRLTESLRKLVPINFLVNNDANQECHLNNVETVKL
jgi:hypothetical protein